MDMLICPLDDGYTLRNDVLRKSPVSESQDIFGLCKSLSQRINASSQNVSTLLIGIQVKIKPFVCHPKE